MIINAFSTEIWQSHSKVAEHDNIHSWILGLYNQSPVKDGNFYGTGFTTHFYDDWTSNLEEIEEFQGLKNLILKNAHEYVLQQMMKLAHLGCPINANPQLRIRKMWFNVNPTHGYQGRHHHAGFLLAGTYYISVPEHSGRIEFTNPNTFAYFKNQSLAHKWLLNNYYAFEPEAGDMLLWPGHLDHEVKTNKSNNPRITVSFCLDWDEECQQ